MVEIEPKTHAERGYVTFLISQHEALAAISDVKDETYGWCFMVAVRAGLPQQMLAERIGVTQPTVSRWSRGDNLPKNPVVRQAYVAELMVCFADFIVSAGGPKLAARTAMRPDVKRRGTTVATAKPV